MNTELEKLGEFQIIPCKVGEFKNDKSYKKISITGDQCNKLLSTVSMVSGIARAGLTSNAYIAKFPKGLPHTLMKFKSGGVGSAIIGDNGKVAGHASFHNISALTASFAILSAITSQYYLHSIDSKLTDIKSISQSILDFLETDKKSELKSEIDFVNRAVNNYDHIISNEAQRISTITNLQSTVKVSIKDCEFYANFLKRTIYRNSHIQEDCRLAFNYKALLENSLSLYTMGSILEAYYAQNFDPKYLAGVKNDLLDHIRSFEKIIAPSFEHLKKRINNTYDTWYWKFDNRGEVLDNIYSILRAYQNKEPSRFQKTTINAFDLIFENKQYYIDGSGNVLVRANKI